MTPEQQELYKKISNTKLKLLNLIKKTSDKNELFTMGNETISNYLKINQSSVRTMISQLKKDGFITVEKETIQKKNGKTIKERVLRLTDMEFIENYKSLFHIDDIVLEDEYSDEISILKTKVELLEKNVNKILNRLEEHGM